MKSSCFLAIALFFSIVFVGQIHAQSNNIASVKIGTQTWMVENLNVDHFANGDIIPEAKSDQEWIEAQKQLKPAWCYYENKAEKGAIYGRLYNEWAVTDARGLAPKGWHIPTKEECEIMINFLGGPNIAGKKMKTKSGWNQNGNGDNSSGFNGKPGGYRDLPYKSQQAPFLSFGGYGVWYYIYIKESSTFTGAISIGLFSDEASLRVGESGMYVRCVKD